MVEKRIFRLAAACMGLASLALVIPRFLPPTEGGFAGAANAVLVFLGVLLVAGLLSLYLLVLTLGSYRQLARVPRIVGIAPAVILFAALAMLLGYLRY